MELIFASLLRKTAASTVGLATCGIFLNTYRLLDLDLLNNTVGAVNAQATGQSMTVLPGDVLSAQTSDASTGGTCDYLVTAKIVEFDA